MNRCQRICALIILAVGVVAFVWNQHRPKLEVQRTEVVVDASISAQDIFGFRVFSKQFPIFFVDGDCTDALPKSGKREVLAVNFPNPLTTSEVLGWMRLHKLRPATTCETLALARKKLPAVDSFGKSYVSLKYIKEMYFGGLSAGFLVVTCEKSLCLDSGKVLEFDVPYYRVRVTKNTDVKWGTDSFFTAVNE